MDGVGTHWYLPDPANGMQELRDLSRGWAGVHASGPDGSQPATKYTQSNQSSRSTWLNICTEACLGYPMDMDSGPAPIIGNGTTKVHPLSIKRAQIYAVDMIGSINSGCNAWLDWSACLDRRGGPGHAQNKCDAAILLTKVRGMTSSGEKANFIRRPMFFALAHIGKFMIPKKSVCMMSAKMNDWKWREEKMETKGSESSPKLQEQLPSGVVLTAWKHSIPASFTKWSEMTQIVIVGCNISKEARTLYVKINAEMNFRVELQPQSIKTYVFTTQAR